MMIVYALRHYKISADDDDYDDPSRPMDFSEIGIYSTQEEAIKAIDRVKGQERFQAWLGGFRIEGHTLDMDGWDEGFVSFDDA